MKKIVVVIPHSHTWLWTGTCVASLLRNPPRASGYGVEIVVVDNSPWSPAIRGIIDTSLDDRFDDPTLIVTQNYKSNRFHASALDCVVETFDFDLMMALETDVIALRPTWLQWFVDQLKPNDYAVGHWHHEQFINPSCTLYRGDVLRWMLDWCKTHAPQDELRWGPDFSLTAPLDNNLRNQENPAEVLRDMKSWICGPFAEKRGWPQGTRLKEGPSGQCKGGGWYEPGQQLHHWAVEQGFTYTVCPTSTDNEQRPTGPMPVQTFYGNSPPSHGRVLEFDELSGKAETVHCWGGTRALDIIKHPVTCQFVGTNTPFWLAREARYWRASVPKDVQEQTLELIRKFGWHYRSQGGDTVTDRDREAAAFVQKCYADGGVTW
jgi:hypothetical protein